MRKALQLVEVTCHDHKNSETKLEHPASRSAWITIPRGEEEKLTFPFITASAMQLCVGPGARCVTLIMPGCWEHGLLSHCLLFHL